MNAVEEVHLEGMVYWIRPTGSVVYSYNPKNQELWHEEEYPHIFMPVAYADTIETAREFISVRNITITRTVEE